MDLSNALSSLKPLQMPDAMPEEDSPDLPESMPGSVPYDLPIPEHADLPSSLGPDLPESVPLPDQRPSDPTAQNSPRGDYAPSPAFDGLPSFQSQSSETGSPTSLGLSSGLLEIRGLLERIADSLKPTHDGPQHYPDTEAPDVKRLVWDLDNDA